jgi:hypothetical protein
VCTNDDKEVQSLALNTIRQLCVSDPEHIEIILRDKKLLETPINTKIASTGFHAKFAHAFGFCYPEGAMGLFDLAREDGSYLDLLNSIDTTGHSVGGIIVKMAVIGAYVQEAYDSFLRGELCEAQPIEQNGNIVGLAIPMPISMPMRMQTNQNPLKERLLEKLTDNPLLQEILNMRCDDLTVAQVLAYDDYLGMKILDLIADKPFFRSIISHESRDGIKLAFQFVSTPEKVDNLLRILERLPVDECKEILGYKFINSDGMGHTTMAGYLALHQNIGERMLELLAKDKRLEGISEENVIIGGKTIKIYDLLMMHLYGPSWNANTAKVN